MGKFRAMIVRTSVFGACVAGAASVAGVACAQSVWETPALPVVKNGDWAGSASQGASAAAAKGMAAANKAGADVSRSTGYGITHPGEVMSKSAAASSITYDETSSGFMEAAQSPLRDFNMMQRAIPAVLLAAEKGPYDAHGLSSCKAIGDQVSALDLALGPDVDTPNVEKTRDPYARNASFVASAALNAVKDVTTKLVPAHNTIRQLSGANKYDRDVKNAILAGAVRRGFLKAYGMMHECDWPAAPIGFQPVRASDWTPEPGVQTTPVRTIASNSSAMVVTVSTVSAPVDADTPAVAATSRTEAAYPRENQAAVNSFAPANGQAGAWRIGRSVPSVR